MKSGRNDVLTLRSVDEGSVSTLCLTGQVWPAASFVWPKEPKMVFIFFNG